jgi:hypothetical protein
MDAVEALQPHVEKESFVDEFISHGLICTCVPYSCQRYYLSYRNEVGYEGHAPLGVRGLESSHRGTLAPLQPRWLLLTDKT